MSREASVSYADLASRAASVSDRLQRASILPVGRVALVSAPRRHDEVIGLAGILTLGAVAVPLDAASPPRRLATIAAGRGCSAIVLDEAARRLVDDMRWGLARVVLDTSGQLVACSGKAARTGVETPDIACILHTSGSTGTPKAVPITWTGLDAFTRWAIDLIGLAHGDRVMRVAELIFDLAWFDHVASWRAGATLVTPLRRELTSGRAALDAIVALAPTV